MDKSAIVVASGVGSRYGGDIPKQFTKIDNKMVVEYTINAFLGVVDMVVLVVSGEYISPMTQYFKNNDKIKICEGGSSRQDSVYKGLCFLQQYNPKLVAIHDGVRMLVSKKMIEDSFDTASDKHSAIPIVPITDSLWFNNNGQWESCNRDNYGCSQTPQTFNYTKILSAHKEFEATLDNFSDCASIYKKYFNEIYIYSGDKDNVKLTTSEDMEFIKYKLKNYYNQNGGLV